MECKLKNTCPFFFDGKCDFDCIHFWSLARLKSAYYINVPLGTSAKMAQKGEYYE